MFRQFQRTQGLQKVGFNASKTMYLIMNISSRVEMEGLTLIMKLPKHGLDYSKELITRMTLIY